MAGSRWLCLVTLAIVSGMLAALPACTGATSQLPATGGLAAEPPLLLTLPFPADVSPGRLASLTQPNKINGAAFHQKSSAASVSGTALQLTSTAGSIEWGIYQFPTAGAALVSVKVDYTPQSGTSVWLGRANFTRLTWDFSGPYVSGTDVPLTTDDVSPGGSFFFAVIAYGGTALLENSATVTTDVAPPSVTVDMDPTFSFTPETVHVDPGTLVVFQNTSIAHHAPVADPLNAVGGGPDSDPTFPTGVPPGESYSWLVPSDAVSNTQWFYHCRFHGIAGDGSHLGTGMVGVIIVN